MHQRIEKLIQASLHRLDGSARFAVDDLGTIFFFDRLYISHWFAQTEEGVYIVQINFPAYVTRRHD